MPKRIYTTELILEIMDAVINEGKSVDEVAAQYYIHKSNIQKWVVRYKNHGVEGIERIHRTYMPEFKCQVIEDLRENHLSYRAAAAKYNIGIHTTIKKWERIYLEEGREGLLVEHRGRATQADNCEKGRKPQFKKEIDEDLIAENQRLRMENEYLKKLNALIHSKGK